MSFSDNHLFFDLDRTIWDFDLNSVETLKFIIQRENLTQLSRNFRAFHAIYKKENGKLWDAYGKGLIDKEKLRYARFENTLAKFSLYDEQLVKRFGDAYVEYSPRQTHLIPGVFQAIKELKNMGFALHIITNGFKEVQFLKLDNCGLSLFFNAVICSEDIGVNKPKPAIFLYACEQAQVKPSEALMIGDDYHADIHGAVSVGMKAIFYNPKKRNAYHHEHEIRHMDELVTKILHVV